MIEDLIQRVNQMLSDCSQFKEFELNTFYMQYKLEYKFKQKFISNIK